MLTQLQLRKFRKLIFKQWRFEKKNNFDKYCIEWTKIRKQKDRRRRRCIMKLYRIEQEQKLRSGALDLAG